MDGSSSIERKLRLPIGFLDKRCSSDDILKVYQLTGFSDALATQLGLKDPQIRAVEQDASSTQDRYLKLLKRWKETFSIKATRRALVDALVRAGKVDTAFEVCRVLYPDHYRSPEPTRRHFHQPPANVRPVQEMTPDAPTGQPASTHSLSRAQSMPVQSQHTTNTQTTPVTHHQPPPPAATSTSRSQSGPPTAHVQESVLIIPTGSQPAGYSIAPTGSQPAGYSIAPTGSQPAGYSIAPTESQPAGYNLPLAQPVTMQSYPTNTYTTYPSQHHYQPHMTTSFQNSSGIGAAPPATYPGSQHTGHGMPYQPRNIQFQPGTAQSHHGNTQTTHLAQYHHPSHVTAPIPPNAPLTMAPQTLYQPPYVEVPSGTTNNIQSTHLTQHHPRGRMVTDLSSLQSGPATGLRDSPGHQHANYTSQAPNQYSQPPGMPSHASNQYYGYHQTSAFLQNKLTAAVGVQQPGSLPPTMPSQVPGPYYRQPSETASLPSGAGIGVQQYPPGSQPPSLGHPNPVYYYNLPHPMTASLPSGLPTGVGEQEHSLGSHAVSMPSMLSYQHNDQTPSGIAESGSSWIDPRTGNAVQERPPENQPPMHVASYPSLGPHQHYHQPAVTASVQSGLATGVGVQEDPPEGQLPSMQSLAGNYNQPAVTASLQSGLATNVGEQEDPPEGQPPSMQSLARNYNQPAVTASLQSGLATGVGVPEMPQDSDPLGSQPASGSGIAPGVQAQPTATQPSNLPPPPLQAQPASFLEQPVSLNRTANMTGEFVNQSRPGHPPEMSGQFANVRSKPLGQPVDVQGQNHAGIQGVTEALHDVQIGGQSSNGMDNESNDNMEVDESGSEDDSIQDNVEGDDGGCKGKKKKFNVMKLISRGQKKKTATNPVTSAPPTTNVPPQNLPQNLPQNPPLNPPRGATQPGSESMEDDVYKMTAAPYRGIGIVINNKEFEDHSTRTGTDIDAGKLVQLFKWLGFDTRRFDNRPSDQIKAILKEVAEECDKHGGYDCVMVAILSHGGDNGIIWGTDGQEVLVKSLTRYFDGSHCKSLREKPKVFILQACRGGKKDQLVEAVDSTADLQNQPDSMPASQGDDPGQLESDFRKSLPSENGFILAFSTTPGYLSWRHPNTGSWYINVLEEQMRKLVGREHFVDILTKVNQILSESEQYTTMSFKQMASFESRLTRKLFFSPPLPSQVPES